MFHMLYILASIWVLHTPNAGQNLLFQSFSSKKVSKPCCVPLYLTVIQLNLQCTLLVIWVLDLLCVTNNDVICININQYKITISYGIKYAMK